MTQNNSNNTYQFFTAYKYGADASKYTQCNHFIRSIALARNDCCFLLALDCYMNLFSSRFHNSCNLGNICLNLTKACVYAMMPCSYSIHLFKSLKADFSAAGEFPSIQLNAVTLGSSSAHMQTYLHASPKATASQDPREGRESWLLFLHKELM